MSRIAQKLRCPLTQTIIYCQKILYSIPSFQISNNHLRCHFCLLHITFSFSNHNFKISHLSQITIHLFKSHLPFQIAIFKISNLSFSNKIFCYDLRYPSYFFESHFPFQITIFKISHLSPITFSFSNLYVKNFTSFPNHNLPFQITLSFSSRNLQKFHVFFLKSQTLKLMKIKSHFPFRITIF